MPAASVQMAEFPNNRFLTPPKLSPLGLDVASIDGGGWAPAQFEGETHDGRQVYCRYRGGWLSIWIANAPGLDALSEGTCLLEERIGPPYHGGLSLEQLCRYAGITINGTMLELNSEDEMQKEGWKDLSGNSTHYKFVQYSTRETARRLFDELSIRVPSSNEDYRNWYFIVEDDAEGKRIKAKSIASVRETAARRNPPPFGLRYFGFRKCPTFSNISIDRFKKDLGLHLRTPGTDETCRYADLFIDATFPADARDQLDRAVKVDEMLNEFFPVTQFICFDLKHGLRLPEKDFAAPFDREIRKWISAGEDRWWHVFCDGSDRNNPQYLGYRPQE